VFSRASFSGARRRLVGTLTLMRGAGQDSVGCVLQGCKSSRRFGAAPKIAQKRRLRRNFVGGFASNRREAADAIFVGRRREAEILPYFRRKKPAGPPQKLKIPTIIQQPSPLPDENKP
ncbi:unnamed protein product, partial [Ectocarpus sp. 12 AP-2014]